MKIGINCKNIQGSYGGVIAFARSLEKYLTGKGDSLVYDLRDDDIDLILITAYATGGAASYSYVDAWAYKLKHPNTIIVLRVNECDERKNTDYMNDLLIKIASKCDYIVYIASWLKPLLEAQGLNKTIPSSVILNGADSRIFNQENKEFWNGKDKLRIVTHHWGGNFMKGHDIYQKLDDLLSEKNYHGKFEFTFIGNIPKNLRYKNTRLIPSLHGNGLSEELKRHHVYITASRNEPAGMHHIEGAMCGLPLLYINSGALPEYCSGFGIEFEPANFEEKLDLMREEYDVWRNSLLSYRNTADKMIAQYCTLFSGLYDEKERYRLKNPPNKFWKYPILAFLKAYSVFDSFLLKFKIAFNIYLKQKNG